MPDTDALQQALPEKAGPLVRDAVIEGPEGAFEATYLAAPETLEWVRDEALAEYRFTVRPGRAMAYWVTIHPPDGPPAYYDAADDPAALRMTLKRAFDHVVATREGAKEGEDRVH